MNISGIYNKENQMEEIINENPLPENVEVVDIQFRSGQKIYYFSPAGKQYQAGDHVIIDTARGAEYGTCTGGNHIIAGKDVVAPLRAVLRRATAQDEKIMEENRLKEKKAHEVCLQKIAEHGLDMQLVSAECAFDGSKILFFFTADERVDFRELVKNLASVFHTRIELRQIGVRDKAKMVGGLGICGRPFCCASFLDDFQPVSIKMAKTQSLSLNPTKISGTCGRLMCCLKYEQDAYEDLLRHTPREESYVDTPEGRGVVTEVNLLRQKVKVRLDENPDTISQFAVEEIAVWRNGKARKSDDIAPPDWAPVSGGGKKTRRLEKLEDTEKLEPIRFRYRQESIVEEAPVAPAEEEEKASNRPRRHRNNRKPEQKKPEAVKPEKEPKPETPNNSKAKKSQPPKETSPKEAPSQENTTADAPQRKSGNRRYNHYHKRKPKAPNSGE